MKLQQLLSYTRKAIDDYRLIEPGDKIAVGLSGGKDSLTLLYALNALKRFYPHPFTIIAAFCDLGFQNINTAQMEQFCQQLQIPLHIVKTEISEIVFGIRQEENPCSLCAKMRKGALNQAVKELGCNKIAYGHHKDDVVETMMLSMIYEGRFHTFAPKTYLDRMEITVIRPLIYVNEAEIKGFCHKENLPLLKNPCPVDGATRREYVKTLLQQINADNPGVKNRMFTAIKNGNLRGWNLPVQ